MYEGIVFACVPANQGIDSVSIHIALFCSLVLHVSFVGADSAGLFMALPTVGWLSVRWLAATSAQYSLDFPFLLSSWCPRLPTFFAKLVDARPNWVLTSLELFQPGIVSKMPISWVIIGRGAVRHSSERSTVIRGTWPIFWRYLTRVVSG